MIFGKSTSLAWEDRFDDEAKIWDLMNVDDMEARDRAFAAIQLALVEFCRKVAGRQHKAQAFLANLEREAEELREHAESARLAKEQEKEDQEDLQEEATPTASDGTLSSSLSLSLWRVGKKMSRAAITVVSQLSMSSAENNVDGAVPEVRLALACEALAQGLSGVITCMDLMEEGVSTASNMKMAIGCGLKLRSALRSMRALVETSKCSTVRDAASKMSFQPEARRVPAQKSDSEKKRVKFKADEESVEEKEEVEVDRKVEHLFLDMQRVFGGTFALGARSATTQWVLRAIGLNADREEGLRLLRAGAECENKMFRLLAMFSLSYQMLIESEEYLLLGLVEQAAKANEEAWEVEKARRKDFPDSKRLGAQVGMRVAFDAIRTGSSRLESRLLFTPQERSSDDGVCFAPGPCVQDLEALGAEKKLRNRHYRLRMVWEVVLQQLRAWDLESLANFLPSVLDDAREFVSTSEAARGCIRNGGILLAALEARNGNHKACMLLLDEVEQLQMKEELEGQFRTTLRIELMRARPKNPCVASVTLIEEIYRYRLMPVMDTLEPLKADLKEVSEILDELPDSWVPLELDLATQLWQGVIAKTEGDLKKAEKILVDVIDLAGENDADLAQIPCLYHLYLSWTELMCVRIQLGETVSAKRCRKAAVSAMHKEVDRTQLCVEDANSGWLGLAGFTNSLKKLFIPPVHPLHPNCPLYFWRLQNLLDVGMRELSSIEDDAEDDDDDTEDQEWFSDDDEPGKVVSDPDAFFSEDEEEPPDR